MSFKKIAMTLALILSTVAAVAQTNVSLTLNCIINP